MDPATAGIEAKEPFQAEDVQTIINVIADVIEAVNVADAGIFPAIIEGLVDELDQGGHDGSSLVIHLADAINRRRAAAAALPFTRWLLDQTDTDFRNLRHMAKHNPAWPTDATTLPPIRAFVEKNSRSLSVLNLEEQLQTAWAKYRLAISATWAHRDNASVCEQYRVVCRWPDGYEEEPLVVSEPRDARLSPRYDCETVARRHNKLDAIQSRAVVQRRCVVASPWLDMPRGDE